MVKNHDKIGKTRNLEIGDKVYARNYREGDKWVLGTIVTKQGQLFGVQTSKGARLHFAFQ